MSDATLLTLWFFWKQIYYVALVIMLVIVIGLLGLSVVKNIGPIPSATRARIWNWVLSISAFGAFIHESFELYLRAHFFS